MKEKFRRSTGHGMTRRTRELAFILLVTVGAAVWAIAAVVMVVMALLSR